MKRKERKRMKTRKDTEKIAKEILKTQRNALNGF